MPVPSQPTTSDLDDIQTMLASVTVPSTPCEASSTPGESILGGGGIANTNISSSATSATQSHAKVLPVMLLTNRNVNNYCLGFIGNHKKAFCLKHKSQCSVASHGMEKFTPKVETYYVCKSADKFAAWCETCIESSQVKLGTEDIDMTLHRPLSEWRAMFDMLEKSDTPPESKSMLDQAIDAITKTDVTSILKTPKKVPPSSGSIMRPPAASDSVGKSLAVFAELKSRFKVLDASFNEKLNAFNPPDASKSLLEDVQDDLGAIITYLSNESQNWNVVSDIAEDLEVLSRNIVGIKQTLGSSIHDLYPTVWSGLEELWSIDDMFNIEQMHETVNKLALDKETLETTVGKHVAYWEAMANNWLPKILSIEEGNKKLKTTFEDYFGDHSSKRVSSNIDRLLNPPEAVPPSATATNQASIDQLKSMIETLSTKVQSLESKTSSMQSGGSHLSPGHYGAGSNHSGNFEHSGTKYRQYYFKDPSEVESWMRANMSHPSHGLFVDLVSFSEFFGGERYVERNTTLSEMYMSSKIGYSTLADSIVAASFQNVLPGAYGRAASSSSNNDDYELTSQAELPGLPSYAKWDNRDGRHGRRFWIREETRKTEQQLDGCIRSQLSGPAQILAKDMLMDSFAMSDAMYNFITSSYEDTMNAGKFDSKQAWTLTCSFVKRIFQELSYERVVARDGIHVDDPWSTSANFLFATMKAHAVMGEFMKLSIKDHPRISSEMVKFVCYSQPTADTSDLVSRVHSVESLQRADQSNIAKLEGRVKKLEGWKNDSDKVLKKLKEKTGV